MSLYTHYRDKSAILRAATEAVIGRVSVPERSVPDLAHLRNVMVNGKLIARGEVVAQGDRFGLRIVELLGTEPDAVVPAVAAPKRAAKGDAA